MVDITILPGVYKPTNITGGAHIVGTYVSSGEGGSDSELLRVSQASESFV